MAGLLRRFPLSILIPLTGVVGLLALAALFPTGSSRVLVVTDVKAGRDLLRARVSPGDEFTLEYVHSVERVAVSGTFAVSPGWQILVRETAFGSFGPGLPELTKGDSYQVQGGMIRQSDVNRVLPELAFRVHPFTHHRLTAKGKTLELSRQVAEGGLVRVTIVPAPFRHVLNGWLRGMQPAQAGSAQSFR